MRTAVGAGGARGVVIKESFRAGGYPQGLSEWIRDEYAHLLGGRLPVTIGLLEIPDGEVVGLAIELANSLLPERYYAHIVWRDRLVVAFPSCIVMVKRGDERDASRAREIGALYGIPPGQMRFEDLFITDHPNGE